MNKLVIGVCVAAAGWWYFHESRKISDEHVRDFYSVVERETLSRNPKGLCKLLDDEYESRMAYVMAGKKIEASHGKDETCSAYEQTYASIDAIGESLGGIATIEYEQKVKSVTISPDRKSATADVSYFMVVAGSVMEVKAESVETLIRRNGKMYLLRSVGKSVAKSGS